VPALTRPRLRELAAFLGLLVASAALALAAVRASPSARVELGPNEADYIGGGFRPGPWEREGCTYFHWTTPSAWLRLPLRVVGEGFVLRARIRRHMVEPAQVTVRVEGRVVSSFSIVSDTKIAYKLLEIPLPSLEGRHPFVLTIESSSVDPRPLGVAIDWVRLDREGAGHFEPPGDLLAWTVLLIAAAYLGLRLTGASFGLSASHAAGMIGAIAFGLHLDLIAGERIVCEGALAYGAVVLILLALSVVLRRAGVAGSTTGWLSLIVLMAVALRLALLLNPRYFYPDVRVHGLVAYQLSREGLVRFLAHYEELQYRFSLGLQFQAGHWYAFPYAPGLYVLAWPLVALHVRPEVAVSLLAACANALEIALTFALARFLLKSERGALIAAVAHAALPLFLIRLSLAYFPSLVGHSIDACAATFLLMRLPRLSLRSAAALTGLMALSLLTYSQALINFGLLFALYLISDVLAARLPTDRRRQILVAMAGLTAVALSLLFYARYVGPFLDMRHGTPMPQEQILLEKQRVEREYAESRGETLVAQPEDDAFAGQDFDPLRGLRKTVVRLFIFYGPFVVTVLWGLFIVVRQVDGTQRRYLLAWSSLFFVTAFLSGALPSPNFLRYGKDLESVAPLFCTGLAAATTYIGRRNRALASAHVALFVVLGLWLGLGKWMSTMQCP
jgi:hypothetical protein